jgi:glycosyltransferase involved in cell wall biosynthesis
MLSPFHHGDLPQNAYIDRVIGLCDLYLAISGPYWFESLAFSPFAHWLPKMRRVDLAADRSEFPPAKQRFAPAGDRRFLYIGNAEPHKSPEYLSAIARRMPGGKISWIGPLTRPIAGVTPLGPHDFRDERARRLVAEYDFLVTVGRADANPTTVLEAMSWGLIPVCTPSSGYVGYDGILNVPVDDPDAAAATLMELDATSDEWLAGLQRDNWELLDSDFTWERFLRRVVDAIESDESPPLLRPPLSRSLRLRAAAARSVHAWARPRNLRHALRTLRSS